MFAVAEADLERARRVPAEQRVERQRLPASTRRRNAATDPRARATGPTVMRPARITKLRIGRCASLVHAAMPSDAYSAAKLRAAASSAASQCAAESLSAPSVTYFAQAKRDASRRGTRAPARTLPCRRRRRRPRADAWRTNPRWSTAAAADARTPAEIRSPPASSSNGVTPGAKPRPLTSMSRCAKRLQATSECAGDAAAAGRAQVHHQRQRRRPCSASPPGGARARPRHSPCRRRCTADSRRRAPAGRAIPAAMP